MNILSNNAIIDNITNRYISSVSKEIVNNAFSHINLDILIKHLKGDSIIPVFRLYLLHDDESIYMDISSEFISGSLSITYQNGQRRSLSAELVNIDDKWIPDPVNGLLWTNTKFRLDTGILIDDTLYWKQQGIFLLKDPSYAYENSNNTVSLNLCDKFGIFDGSLGYTTSLKTIIPVGVSIYDSFITILNSDKGDGTPWDFKKIIFDGASKHVNTFYTIKQDAGTNIGDIFIRLGETISCDIYYNEYGNMCVESNINKFISNNFPVSYRFSENDKDILSKNTTENWSSMINEIKVKGAITNGYQFSSTVRNENPKSKYCIQFNGTRTKMIENAQLYSDKLCDDQARYEMLNLMRGVKTLNLSCSYIPMLDVNQSFIAHFPDENILNENYIINTISMNIGSNPTTSITATNIEEMVLV